LTVTGSAIEGHDVVIDASASLTVSGTVMVDGSWSNSGTFTHAAGTVVFAVVG
jgi:hypothetical protein